jgi:hypothetical protein
VDGLGDALDGRDPVVHRGRHDPDQARRERLGHALGGRDDDPDAPPALAVVR